MRVTVNHVAWRCSFHWSRAGGASLALALTPGLAAAGTIDCRWLEPAAAAKFSSIAADCPATADPAPEAALVEAEPLPVSIGVAFTVPQAAGRPGAASARHAGASPAPGFVRPTDLVGAVAARHRIDPLLLGAIIARESAGRPRAVSVKGALGLMQVMPTTGRALGVRDPRDLTDPAVNLVAGATYLKQMQARFGNDLALTLAAYNAGPGAVARHRGIPPYAETRAYVANILGRYAAARQDAGR